MKLMQPPALLQTIFAALKRANVPLVLFFVALFLRVFRIDFYDFWFDEASSYIRIMNNWNASDYIAPAFYLFLYGWTQLFGTEAAAMRLPSAIFGALSVVPFYLAAKRVFSVRIAFWASLLLIFSPFQIWYGQEARPYGLILFEACLAWLLMIKCSESWSKGYNYALLVVLGLSVVTDYRLAIFLLLLATVYSSRPALLFLGAVGMAVAVLVVSYLSVFKELFFSTRLVFDWVLPPTPLSLLVTLNNFLFGYVEWRLFNETSLALTAMLLLVILLNRGADAVRLKWIVFFPLVAVFLMSKLVFPFYVDRYFIFCAPFFYLLIVVGLARLASALVRNALSIILAFSVLFAQGLYFTGALEHPEPGWWAPMHIGVPFKHKYRNVADFLSRNGKPQDYVLFSERASGYPIIFYLATDPQSPFRNSKQLKMVATREFVSRDYYEASFYRNRLWRKNRVYFLLEDGLPPAINGQSSYWLVTAILNRRPYHYKGSNMEAVRKGLLNDPSYKKVRALMIDGSLVEEFVPVGRTAEVFGGSPL